MKRRDFFRRVGGGTVAASFVLVHQPRIVPNDEPRSYPCHDWRGYLWWIGPNRELRWKKAGEPAQDLDFVFHASHRGLRGFECIAGPVRDQLWLVSDAGWLTFEFADRPDGDSARLIFRRYHDAT